MLPLLLLLLPLPLPPLLLLMWTAIHQSPATTSRRQPPAVTIRQQPPASLVGGWLAGVVAWCPKKNTVSARAAPGVPKLHP